MKKKLRQRLAALGLAAASLWTALCSESIAAPSAPLSASVTKALLQWELGDLWQTGALSPAALLALRQSPVLLRQRQRVAAAMGSAGDTPAVPSADPPTVPVQETETPEPPASEKEAFSPFAHLPALQFADNGVPAQTVDPSGKGYTAVGNALIKNNTDKTLDTAFLADGQYAAKLTDAAPQVLIVHTHGCEAYTMPPGEEYETDTAYRTTDCRYNVVRVGDEIAAVLSAYGISVLHDRTLHDDPYYNDAYTRSEATIRSYLAQYPSLVFVLDVHRDAIQDAAGQQYKLISREDPHCAQVSFVMGNGYDTWQENLKLATDIVGHIKARHPTMMRPITLRGYRYNQFLTPGTLLVEMGAAGNSLDEALCAARNFARGFAETLLEKGSVTAAPADHIAP